jgi:uncharacterized protein (TIGR02118 family)
MITFFLVWDAAALAADPLSEAEDARLVALLRGVHGLSHALVYTPTSTHDPYLDDGPPPALALQLYFHDIADLEAACAADGILQALPRLSADVTQQAMLARTYPVDGDTPAAEPACTYLVAYTGRAEDLNAWLAYYIAHHPPIMRRFPGIRGIEICTRLDWCSFLPCRRVEYMQRNKVVFDSAPALTAALNSPVRHEMREDFRNFPPFSGGNTHFPMVTRTVAPTGANDE